MSYAGIETVNLYSGFMALALDLLKEGGELVAIIPRSFCNGPYYKAFREKILKDSSIQRIHVFDSRTDAFSDDGVLQENIIIHLIKGKNKAKSSSALVQMLSFINQKKMDAFSMINNSLEI